MATGVRYRFVPRGTVLRVELRADDRAAPIDLVVDGQVAARREVPSGESFVAFDLPEGSSAELWLPQFGTVEVRSLLVDDLAPQELEFPERRWIAYGSSLTQCKSAAGPSETWPAILSRRCGLDLECIGLAGECHLDPAIADYIHDAEPDFVTLCIGINVYEQASFSARSFAPAVRAFIERVARSRAQTLVIGPVASPRFEDQLNRVGMSLDMMREHVHSASQDVFQRYSNVRYLDGRYLLSLSDDHLFLDGVHPTAEGHRVIAERMIDRFPEGELGLTPLVRR
ncbi:hypothetical protein FVO59_04005 [Microbacterium esteraromaticum]|uniref:SGNH hydrolase-type esterase domain-containing protein n=1 Tax=Microbacterium esteraromaticum TaxID=57043 RepID=A0A7D8AAS0_9MICO|nr:GDSL-type esterase/lipase family protein [Microbacterium esteraromaticum]QMU96464.1 hypothetical protein FVO59_04005 [Microbacterium esteraromaticum]